MAQSQKSDASTASEAFKGSLKGSFKGSLKGCFKGSLKGSLKGSFKGSLKGSFKGSLKGSFKGSCLKSHGCGAREAPRSATWAAAAGPARCLGSCGSWARVKEPS